MTTATIIGVFLAVAYVLVAQSNKRTDNRFVSTSEWLELMRKHKIGCGVHPNLRGRKPRRRTA